MSYNWLIQSKYAVEEGYPNKLELDSLAILSGREKYPASPCIFKGSIGAARDIQRLGLPNIKLFMGYTKNSFDANVFMESFGQDALNYECMYLTWGQIWRHLKKVKVFVRPVSGFKVFTGGVLSEENMYERLEEIKVPYETLCQVSQTKPIEAEYRLVIAGRDIIGSTRYLPDESPEVPECIFSAAREFLVWLTPPDDIYCLDLCISCGKIKLLEWNAFNTSGLYATDIPKMCEALEKYLLKLEDEVHV